MALSLTTAEADAILACLLNGTSYTGHALLYVQLHVGDPGVAGTSNPAGNTTRQAIGTSGSSMSAPSGGISTNAAAINWTSVSTSETYTDVSLWTAVSAGTFIAAGTISAAAITSGQNFQIAIGALSVSLTVTA
jgi:hypothetical protein